jgi:hypothetical protein
MWRGGRPFKQQQNPPSPKPKTNGASNDAIMIIDSDEEEPAPQKSQPHVQAEFEDEEHELDPTEPFYDILQTFDIPLGAKALALSVPSIPSDDIHLSAKPLPPILKKSIVVAVVCSDCTTKIVTLPLTPPAPQLQGQKEPTTAHTQICAISGASTHQDIASGIAITFTGQSLLTGSRSASQHDIGMDVENEKSVMSTRNGGRPSAPSKAGDGWELLMATYSDEAAGVLLVYRIPILEEKSQSTSVFKFSTDHIFPIQKHFLHTHATKLSFNPSSYPSDRHSHLLVSTTGGAVKLYSCVSPKADRSSRGRRTSDTDLARDMRGKWLVSLYPGFSISPSGIPQRKPVLDAEWVLNGKAIIALLSDGEWGIWDLEGAGPGAAQSLVRGQSNVQGVTGGALTSFAINGWANPAESTKSSSAATTSEITKPKLAPMTPHTRKAREESLFKPAAPVPTTAASMPFANGSISVITHSTNPRDSKPDESIIVHYASQNVVIPSLLSHWRTKVKTAGTFESSARFRPSPLEGINLLGEHQLGVSQFPPSPSSNCTSYFRPSSARHPDVLIIGERRLHILAAPLMPAPKTVESSLALAKPVQAKQEDQVLLVRGELDVEGMDRILDGMTNGTGNVGNRVSGRMSPTKRRRVGFA